MTIQLLLRRVITTTILFAWVLSVSAQTLLTEKKVFTLPNYQTVGGATIKNVKVGYETYGTLNAAGDNAIFVAHFYSGTSHAAGKYKTSDVASGYWDSIIGPDKPVDTNRYFVVSADTLSNLNTKDPNVTTTGPASINSETGKPYGMSFPVISMRDSVRVHKALTDALGIKKFQAVMGASGGSIQAMEWGALYPDQVARVIHVIGPGFSITPWAISLLEAWVAPIRQDPKWNGGDYYGKAEPVDGVAQSLKLVGITTRSWGFDERVFGYKPADADKPPAAALDNKFLVEAAFIKAGATRAALSDANSNLYMAKANQLFNVESDVAGMKSKILFIPAKSDLVFPPVFAESAAAKYKALGKTAEVFELQGDGGHLEGVLNIAQAGQTIKDFLAR